VLRNRSIIAERQAVYEMVSSGSARSIVENADQVAFAGRRSRFVSISRSAQALTVLASSCDEVMIVTYIAMSGPEVGAA
jgi:hypothetical protein